MRGLPPEVDRLMWAVAENPTPTALDEFGQRYPQYRSEMLRRMEMVKGLRSEVRPQQAGHRSEIPKFQMREVSPSGPPRGVFLVAGLSIAAIAAASYTAFSGMRTPPARPKVAFVPRVNEELPKAPPIYYRNPSPPPPTPQPVEPTAVAEQTPQYLKPRSFHVRTASLMDALSLVTANTGIHLEAGPGFVNQSVTVDYDNVDTVSILRDMAKQFGFHISDEGGGNFLAIPVPDEPNGALNAEHVPKPSQTPDTETRTGTRIATPQSSFR